MLSWTQQSYENICFYTTFRCYRILVSNDNEEKAGYLYVENNLDNPVDYSDKSEVQSALSYDGGELDPAVIEPGYYTFPLSLKFKYLDEQFKQRHGD